MARSQTTADTRTHAHTGTGREQEHFLEAHLSSVLLDRVRQNEWKTEKRTFFKFTKGWRNFTSSFSGFSLRALDLSHLSACRCVFVGGWVSDVCVCVTLCMPWSRFSPHQISNPPEHKIWPFKDRDRKALGTSIARKWKQKEVFPRV